jgi:hypothetical protein
MSTAMSTEAHVHGADDRGADDRGADDHGAEDGGDCHSDLLLMASRTRTSWKGSEAVTRDVTCGGPCPSCWVTCGIERCSACLLYRGWPLMAALSMNGASLPMSSRWRRMGSRAQCYI